MISKEAVRIREILASLGICRMHALASAREIKIKHSFHDSIHFLGLPSRRMHLHILVFMYLKMKYCQQGLTCAGLLREL